MTAVPPRPAAGDPDFPYMLADTPEEFERVRGIGIPAAPDRATDCRQCRHLPPLEYPAPDATAGDGLRSAIEDRLERYWEHGVPDWAVDDLLALPALRDVLAAAARDAETLKGLADFATDMINAPDDSAADWGYDLAHRLGLLDGAGQ